MEWRRYGQRHRALGAHVLGDLDGAVDRALVARDHDLRRIIVIGDGAHLALGCGVRDLLGKREVGAEQRRHCAHAHRHRRLHRLSAQLEQLCRGREVERACRAQSRIFAKAVAGDEARGPLKIDPAVPGQRAIDGERIRHDRRLGIFGELELVLRTVPHQTEQVLAERLIDFMENIVRGSACLGERGAHADRLAALSRKNECAHFRPCYEPPGRLSRHAAIAKAGEGR